MDSLILYFIVFIFGACLGSFLNCVIYRLKEKKSFLTGRSFCPHCRHELGFFDLLPIFSFLSLRGKCRYCKKPISWQYPLVEISTGLIFLLIFNFSPVFGGAGNFQNFVNFVYLIIISSLLIIIFVYDFKHYLIPDVMVYPAVGIILLFNIINYLFPDHKSLLNFFLSGAAPAFIFFLIWFLSKGKWMGFGDVKLVFLLGFFLGFPNVLTALFLGFFSGASVGLVLIFLKEKTLKSKVPLGPFLIAGGFCALFWGKNIIDFYLSLLI